MYRIEESYRVQSVRLATAYIDIIYNFSTVAFRLNNLFMLVSFRGILPGNRSFYWSLIPFSPLTAGAVGWNLWSWNRDENRKPALHLEDWEKNNQIYINLKKNDERSSLYHCTYKSLEGWTTWCKDCPDRISRSSCSLSYRLTRFSVYSSQECWGRYQSVRLFLFSILYTYNCMHN